MAAKKALVILDDGNMGVLPSTDYLSGAFSDINLVTLQNKETALVSKGQVVYISGSNQVKLANKSADATKDAAFMVYADTIAADASGDFIEDGVISMADWTTVTGSASLTPGAVYFLTTGGGMSTTPPTTGWSVKVGKALSATDFNFNASAPIKVD